MGEKLIGINPRDFEYADAFQPRYNEQACKRIQDHKDAICKTKSPVKCFKTDRPDQLVEKHNNLMSCRNIRMVESFSNCKSRDWFRSNGIGHVSQTNQLLRSASECVDYYVKKYDRASRPVGYIKDRKTVRRRKLSDKRY